MWKKQAQHNFFLLLKAGIPFTVAGMIIVFVGILGLKYFFSGSDYLTLLIFVWLGIFWFIYQPLFRKKIREVDKRMRSQTL
jgi:hypothetical protein